MPIVHCMSNSDVSEVDIRTDFAVNAFLFRFIDRTSREIKQITATDEEQARDVLGGTLVFAARFRRDDNCRVTGGCHGTRN